MDKKGKVSDQEQEPIPAGQNWFDRIFLLLILSILISGLFYNVWGVIELFIIR